MRGGCRPSGCFKDSAGKDIPYTGADFDYLAAHVVKKSGGQPRMVTSAASYGQVLTETHLRINTASGQVMRDHVTAVNHLVTRDVAKDQGETKIIDFWRALAAPLAGRVVGTLAANTDITGDASTCRCEETPMVDTLADAIL